MRKEVLGSLTAKCISFRLRKRVLSRNQRNVAARIGTVQLIVAARGKNSAATVGAPAMVTVEDELRPILENLVGLFWKTLGLFARIV